MFPSGDTKRGFGYPRNFQCLLPAKLYASDGRRIRSCAVMGVKKEGFGPPNFHAPYRRNYVILTAEQLWELKWRGSVAPEFSVPPSGGTIRRMGVVLAAAHASRTDLGRGRDHVTTASPAAQPTRLSA